MAKPTWVTCSPSQGGGGSSVSVSASQNTATSQRSGSFTVKTTSGLSKSVSVQQNAAQPVQDPYIQFNGGSGSIVKNGATNTLGLNLSLRLGSRSNTVSLSLSPSKWGSSTNSIERIQAGSIKTFEYDGSVSLPYTNVSTSLVMTVTYRANASWVPITVNVELDTYTSTGSAFSDSDSITLS